MEDFVIFQNGRPLSLPPSFPSSSPTSPVANCCCSKYKSKSSHEIYEKNLSKLNGKSSKMKKRKKTNDSTAAPRLPWSVFKSKGSIFGNSPREPGSNAKQNGNSSRFSSWTYAPEEQNIEMKHPPRKKKDMHLTTNKDGLFPEKKQRPVITPTYQTAFVLNLSNSDAQRHYNGPAAQSDPLPRNNPITTPADSQPRDLRKLLLSKSASSTEQHDTFTNAEVPRSPGPLDGSPYAQVKKKRRSTKTNMSLHQSANRAFHSADEISFAKSNVDVTKVLANRRTAEDGTTPANRHQTHSTEKLKIDCVIAEEASSASVASQNQLLDSRSSVQANAADCRYHTIDSTDCRESNEQRSGTPGNDLQSSIDIKRNNSFKSGAVVKSSSVGNNKEEELNPTPFSSPQEGDKTANSRESSEAEVQREKENTKECFENTVDHKDYSRDGDVGVIERKEELSMSKSDSTDMRTQPKKQLTKEEVRDAVALINECLSDQELRTGSLSPDDPHLSMIDVVKSANDGGEASVQTFVQQGDLNAEAPTFSPASPDYNSEEAARLFADKSPEYALPVRDVIHKSISTRCAEIRSQEKSFDNVVSSLAASRKSSEENRPMTLSTRPEDCIKDGQNPLPPPTVENQLLAALKVTSNSDVDSGIEGGGALNTSAGSDAKTTSAFPKERNHSSVPSSSTPHQQKQDVSVEDEVERKVREEIENTQKRLTWLQEQQSKLKKQKEKKVKRHSCDYNIADPTARTQVKATEYSATLPRPPAHHFKAAGEQKNERARRPSPQEQKDVDELLRSVQEVDFSSGSNASRHRTFSNPMSSATLPTRSQHSLLRETSTGGRAAPQNVASVEKTFTPAYAHPMHQPQHMQLHHYQLQQNSKNSAKKSAEEKWRLQQHERQTREEKKKAIDMQEKRREEERAKQLQFERDFEEKQKQLLKEKRMQNMSHHPTANVHAAKTTSSRKQIINVPGSSTTLPSPRKLGGVSTTSGANAKSDELQAQLDELDRYIALLSQNTEVTPVGNPSLQSPSGNAEPSVVKRSNAEPSVVKRRRSFSIEIDRKMDPSIPLSPDDEGTNSATMYPTPPKPPSRTRSSFESVSRRLSHGFELAQMMRQNSVEQDLRTSTKDDDVFAATPTIQPSYPPQTHHTRPIQQQITTTASAYTKDPKKANNDLEENLSPQLFLAMAVNPGARPIADIHSYKEDLDTSAPRMDVVDGPQVSTPNFPVSPPTPYMNDSSISPAAHNPAGLVRTPLSALGLKPGPRSLAAQPVPTTSSGYNNADSATQQQSVTLNGRRALVTGQGSVGDNNKPHRTFAGGRLEAASHPQAQPLRDSRRRQEISNDSNPSGGKATLLSNHSHDSGYADANHQAHPSNGWMQSQQASASNRVQSNSNPQKDSDLKSPWVHSGGSSPYSSSSTGGKTPGTTFTYPASASGEVSSSASRSLTGSNDSLLSDGSSSSQPHFAYQQQRLNGSHPSPSQKDSSQRNSGSSTRSSSTGGSGYLGGTSRTSPHSAGSPASSAAGQYPLTQPSYRRESQMSSYDRQGIVQGHSPHVFIDEGRLSSPLSGRTSSSSTSDMDRLTDEMTHSGISGATPKFIRDTTSYWYKPDITREQALAMLRDKPPGSFVVRDSRCYPGAFGLAIKVYQVPAAVLATAKPGTDMHNELVRHFLIEPSSRGVKLKGFANEPVFGSLSALIYQHSITPLDLPCRLVIPTDNQEVPQLLPTVRNTSEISNSDLLRQGAACNVLYLNSVDTESLTGPEAIERAMRECVANESKLKTSVVHFKVSPQGITLTDNARKVFFRRHYPTATVTYCGLDPSSREPHNRRWDISTNRGPAKARVFGFVAKKSGSTVDNVCHLFAELDLDQPAPAIVNFLNKLLIGSG